MQAERPWSGWAGVSALNGSTFKRCCATIARCREPRSVQDVDLFARTLTGSALIPLGLISSGSISSGLISSRFPSPPCRPACGDSATLRYTARPILTASGAGARRWCRQHRGQRRVLRSKPAVRHHGAAPLCCRRAGLPVLRPLHEPGAVGAVWLSAAGESSR